MVTPSGSFPAGSQAAAALGAFEEALALVKQQDSRGAEERFVRAVGLAERIPDRDERRHTYGWLGVMLIRCGFAALAERMAREAIQLSHQARDDRGVVANLLTFGTALSRLGQTDRALEAFTQARDLAVSLEDFGDAASASTNFAGTLMKLGRITEAVPHLNKSLDWLKDHAFPDTEIQTRLNLLSAYDALREPPERSFALARETLDRLGPHLNAWGYRKMLSQIIDRVLKRYLRAHRKVSRTAWIVEHFPELQDVL